MSDASSRLCQTCGLCCDGSLFFRVHLQATDSAPALKQLGFRIQHKKRYDFFEQPCVAFKNRCCSVYQERPNRCREFQCHQLKLLAHGETTEEEVLKKIREAQSKIDVIKELLYDLGPTNSKKPLLQQYQQIVADPIDSSVEQALIEKRSLLDKALFTLNQFLDQEFKEPFSCHEYHQEKIPSA